MPDSESKSDCIGSKTGISLTNGTAGRQIILSPFYNGKGSEG